MFDFNIENIKTAITSYDHNGNEMDLQCILARSLGLCLANCNANCKFSPSISICNFNKNQNGAGLELGFKPQSVPPKVKNARRYIDLASVAWNGGDKPASINWLCEVKIIDPKCTDRYGRWYPYLYHYNCYPPEFNFLQGLHENIMTDADEGQIIFDFIKMMACRQKITPVASLYQILAIKNAAGHDFEYWRDKLVCLLKDWSKWCDVKADQMIKIYDWKDIHGEWERGRRSKPLFDEKKIALQCTLKGVTGCAITDLGSSNEYQHILIDWQPGKGKNVFAFK